MLSIILLLTTIYYCKPDNNVLIVILLICCILLKQYDIEQYSFISSKNLIKNTDFHKSNIINTPENITQIMKSDNEDKKQQLKYNTTHIECSVGHILLTLQFSSVLDLLPICLGCQWTEQIEIKECISKVTRTIRLILLCVNIRLQTKYN